MATLGQGGVSPVPGSAQGDYPQYFGVYYGTVSNNADPNKQNRCLLRVPMLLGSAVTTWAVSLTPLQNPPAVGTLIACMFIGGDVDYPSYMVIDPKILVESVAGNIKPIGTTSSAGTSVKLAAADHVHGNISTLASDMQPDGTAAAGSSGRVADAQHVHPQPSSPTFSSLTVENTMTADDIDCTGTIETLNIEVNGYFIGSTTTPGIASLPNDPNSGTGWVSGERAFMNNNWVANINANFSNIIAALQGAGIFH